MRKALRDLRTIVGDAGYLTDPNLIEPMLVDERDLYHGRAAAVIQPTCTEQLSSAVKVCAAAGIAMVPQGGNTGYCGGATPDNSGSQVVISLARMHEIRPVDKHAFTLSADAGATLAQAQAAAAAANLLLPLSMGSEGSCQLGGVVSTNAGGLSVLRYGTARDLVAGLEVVLPDGRVLRDLKGLRKDNTGYDLKQIFIGAEGTLGIVSAVVLQLFSMPHSRVTAWLAVDNIGDAVSTLASLRSRLGECISSFEYVACEAMQLVLQTIPETRRPLNTDANFALIEIASFEEGPDHTDTIEQALSDCVASGEVVIAQNERERAAFWRLRESIPQAEKHQGGSIKHDVSVALSVLGDFAEEAQRVVARQFPDCRLSVYGHIGDGNIHFNVLAADTASAAQFKRENSAAVSDLVHSMALERQGSFSAEHGVGQFKRDLLAKTTDPISLELMRSIKQTLDPAGLMNPGKVL